MGADQNTARIRNRIVRFIDTPLRSDGPHHLPEYCGLCLRTLGCRLTESVARTVSIQTVQLLVDDFFKRARGLCAGHAHAIDEECRRGRDSGLLAIVQVLLDRCLVALGGYAGV